MAVQRRIIWLDDPTWAELIAEAEKQGMNPSRYIVYRLRGSQENVPLAGKEEVQPHVPGQGIYGGVMTQGKRDEILRKMSKK